MELKWYLLLVATLALIVMSILWFIYVPNPNKLANLTWLYGWLSLVLGLLGFSYVVFGKLRLHDKAYEKMTYY